MGPAGPGSVAAGRSGPEPGARVASSWMAVAAAPGRIVSALGDGRAPGIRGGFGPGSRDGLIRLAQLPLQGGQLGPKGGPKGGPKLLWDLVEVILDAGFPSVSPVGLEPAANLVDGSGLVEVQAVEVVTGPVGHRHRLPHARCIGCSSPDSAPGRTNPPGCQ